MNNSKGSKLSYNPYIAAHRFGLGSGVEEMKIISKAPKSWLLNQVKTEVDTSLKGSFKNTQVITKQVIEIRRAKTKERKQLMKAGFDLYRYEMEMRFKQAISTNTPLIERLTMFWSNHFAVSLKGKPFLAALTGVYEREAIRPHVLGKFSDMLRSVVEHPAMLAYLDNVQSIGPNSIAGKRRGKGLNENLAREIMELHTLGVDGGYSQDDVIEFAKILTGWTVRPKKLFGGGGKFEFIERIHEPGRRILLGKTYNQKGQDQGIVALNDLAKHPSTARFIATKLARHFISDDPPKSAIKKLERSFLKSGGDLRELTLTLINMAEVWERQLPKIKTPYEMVVASFRAVNAPIKKVGFEKIAQSLALLDHLPFQAPSPQGWPDRVDDWLSPNAMMNRVEWCHAFAQVMRPKESPLELAQNLLSEVASGDTMLWIERAPSPVDGLALLLASPQWQRR